MKKTSHIVLRPAKPSDLPVIFRLSRVPALAAPNHPRDEKIWIRDFLKAKQILFVAVRDRQIIGFVMGETVTGRTAILQLIVVDQRSRERGIGSRLHAAFEEECRRRRIECVLTYGYARSNANDKFFKAQGYAAGSPVREYQKYLRRRSRS